MSFSLLLKVAQPSEQALIWSAEQSVEGWLAFERALAVAQSQTGDITPSDAAAIVRAAIIDSVDEEELWSTARLVGYPVLGLVRQIVAATEGSAAGRVHFGATTQDVMDTGFALQMQRSLASLDRALFTLGNRLASQVTRHAGTVMAARTHAQQAVPTTFGATLATVLQQLTRHRIRLSEARPRIEVVSLFGAGGTSAAYGHSAAMVRRRVAELLNLGVTDVSWHADRDAQAEFGWLCATVSATCGKIARNVIDLSRTEIGELSEQYARHRGASSTMPQKVNPISSEIIVGLSATAGALAASLPRIQDVGHERAAGEWHIEWHVLPQLADIAGRALEETSGLMDGLRVNSERMRLNLELDGGLVMAESIMIKLAGALGQAAAHDLVYAAAQRARRDGMLLRDAISAQAAADGVELPPLDFSPETYLGDAQQMCRAAVEAWHALEAPTERHLPVSELAICE